MKRDLLLVLGILLATASQLRPAGASIGPGEVCLMVWIVLMLGRETIQLGPQFTPPLSRMLIFWLLFAVAQSVGTLTGFAIGDIHDFILVHARRDGLPAAGCHRPAQRRWARRRFSACIASPGFW